MAMNGSSIGLNEPIMDIKTSLHASRRRPADIPLISTPTWVALIVYLFTLAMTQTVYFEPFMNIRWVALGALTAATLADWILVGGRERHKSRGNNSQLLSIYLLATFGTVIYAENWLFSGMRWVSHAAMLLVFIVYLPQMMVPKQTQKMLLILKCIMSSLLVFSWLRPIIELVPDSEGLYHGAMGNANSMGHVAFIAALLFLSSALTAKTRRNCIFSTAMMVAAAGTVWQSGARSSIIGLSFGVLLLFYYYRRETQRYVIIAILLGGITMIAFPNLPGEISRFMIKSDAKIEATAFNPMRSRMPSWTASWNGFKERPLLGWGFGASNNVTGDVEITLTSSQIVQRDPVNDFLFMLEGCGVVGFAAYMLLIIIVFKQNPGKSLKPILQRFRQGQDISPDVISLHEYHVVLYVLSVCLIILNQFDNSALSAGNLISVTLWLCAGCAITLHHEIG
jgi:O-antigen ligase